MPLVTPDKMLFQLAGVMGWIRYSWVNKVAKFIPVKARVIWATARLIVTGTSFEGNHS